MVLHFARERVALGSLGSIKSKILAQSEKIVSTWLYNYSTDATALSISATKVLLDKNIGSLLFSCEEIKPLSNIHSGKVIMQ